MTVRHLLGGATLTAALSLMAAGSAFAQFSFSTTSPTVGTVLGTNGGGATVSVTSVSTNSAVPIGSPSTTPFFNYNKNINAAGSFSSGTLTLSVTASKAGWGAATNGAQSLNFSVTGHIDTTGTGTVVIDSTPGFFPGGGPLVFTFADGSTLTMSNFVVTNATTSDGVFGFHATSTAPTIAPEPGSLALAATGLLSALGMFGVRRRRVAA